MNFRIVKSKVNVNKQTNKKQKKEGFGRRCGFGRET